MSYETTNMLISWNYYQHHICHYGIPSQCSKDMRPPWAAANSKQTCTMPQPPLPKLAVHHSKLHSWHALQGLCFPCPSALPAGWFSWHVAGKYPNLRPPKLDSAWIRECKISPLLTPSKHVIRKTSCISQTIKPFDQFQRKWTLICWTDITSFINEYLNIPKYSLVTKHCLPKNPPYMDDFLK